MLPSACWTRCAGKLVRRELDRLLVAAAQEKTTRPPRGRLSRSQLARLRLRLRREAGSDDFGNFRDYLDGTKSRKAADDQFRGYYVGGRNFRDWLADMAEHPQKTWDEIVVEKDWQAPVLGDKAYEFRSDSRLTHEYALHYMSAICEQLAKREAA